MKSVVKNNYERRRSLRIECIGEVWYRDHNKPAQGLKHAYIKNISEHGLLFESYESFPICTILELKIDLIGMNQKRFPEHTFINVLAEVVRGQEIRRTWLYHMGVSFCRIKEKDQIFLEKYLKNIPRNSQPVLSVAKVLA